jgi:hypothetical protein
MRAASSADLALCGQLRCALSGPTRECEEEAVIPPRRAGRVRAGIRTRRFDAVDQDGPALDLGVGFHRPMRPTNRPVAPSSTAQGP